MHDGQIRGFGDGHRDSCQEGDGLAGGGDGGGHVETPSDDGDRDDLQHGDHRGSDREAGVQRGCGQMEGPHT